jgi:hypothetical protein
MWEQVCHLLGFGKLQTCRHIMASEAMNPGDSTVPRPGVSGAGRLALRVVSVRLRLLAVPVVAFAVVLSRPQ